MAKYKCPTLGDCDHANRGEIFERAPGEDLKCPGCGTLLNPVATPEGGTSSGGKTPLMAIGAVVLVALAGGGYYFSATSGKTPEAQPPAPAPLVEQAPTPAAQPVPAPSPTAVPGIAPSDTETRALRQESQDKLISGDAASAEQAGSRAAANEMLKLAIAKMTQGKLDEAEKDLLEARARDPKQPLVAYNLAVLRLKQGRRDDALKEFEASFMAGFSHFDKMDQDPDLDGLRKDARFTKLVAEYRNKLAK